MDHRSAGKIQRPAGRKLLGMLAAVGQDPAAPDPMAQRAVDQRAPQDHEHDHRAELHSLGKRPADQGRRDDEEHALEQHVGHHGNRQSGEQRPVRTLCRSTRHRRPA